MKIPEKSMITSQASAWMLILKEGLYAAVGEREMVHLLPYTPTLFEIPGTPTYCRHVLVWQDQILPLVDLCTYMEGNQWSEPSTSRDTLVGIFAYQAYAGETPQYGGLMLLQAPWRANVTDKQACGLPERLRGWAPLVISCFQDSTHGPIPILDLKRIFLNSPRPESVDASCRYDMEND